jgi:hypothetical protein
LCRDLGFDVNHSRLLGLAQHSFMPTPRTLTIWLSGWLFTTSSSWWKASAAARQAGADFAIVATLIFFPYEIYDLTVKVTLLRVMALVISLLPVNNVRTTASWPSIAGLQELRRWGLLSSGGRSRPGVPLHERAVPHHRSVSPALRSAASDAYGIHLHVFA